MPRIARAIAVEYPHHVVQRGNNRQEVFFDDDDRNSYLSLLRNYSQKWNSPILAYCLMDNHVHLLTKPMTHQSLSKMMQGVTLCYTQHVNRKFERTGRLWESRYHSCMVDTDRYLWAVARYIEQNPVRAGLVKRAEEYTFSSAPAHVTGTEDSVIGEDLFGMHDRRNYILLMRRSCSSKEMENIRYHARTGRPYGTEKFVSALERKLRRSFKKVPRGRPLKTAD